MDLTAAVNKKSVKDKMVQGNSAQQLNPIESRKDVIMTKSNISRILFVACLLHLSCASSFESMEFNSIDSRSSPFYKNIIGSMDYYAVSYDGKPPVIQQNRECFFEFLDNGWFLQWKSQGNKLTECSRGLWAIADSALILKYMQMSIPVTIAKDTVHFTAKEHSVQWPLWKVTNDSLVTRQKSGFTSSFPKRPPHDPDISKPCKRSFLLGEE